MSFGDQFLLDTHTFLWLALDEPRRLVIITEPANSTGDPVINVENASFDK